MSELESEVTLSTSADSTRGYKTIARFDGNGLIVVVECYRDHLEREWVEDPERQVSLSYEEFDALAVAVAERRLKEPHA